ncbi:MAG TPA: RNA polymerase sigma factor [Polyangiaceae bacterium]|nr:RNA polymerase sigma factor [Polyangiaceae bacterium]
MTHETPWVSGLLAEVADREGSALYRRAQALAGQPSDAWDLLQEAFARALEHRPDVASGEKLKGWLAVTLRNLCLDRRRTAQRRLHIALADDVPGFESHDDPEPARWRCVDEADLARFTSELDPRLREVFELHAREGLPLTTIAKRLGVPAATVGTRLHRARRHLRAKLLAGEPAPLT